MTGSEARTRPFVASVFWQAYTHSRGFASVLELVKQQNPKLRVRLVQVVPHAAGGGVRYDLLVLAEGFSHDDTYYQADAYVDPADLRSGSAIFTEQILKMGGAASLLKDIDHAAIAREAHQAQPFGVLVLPAPSMVPTAFVPSPPLKVVDAATGRESSAGVYAVNRSGQAGVTVAWHAVQDSVGGVVQVGGVVGRIVGRGHELSDSAFIEVFRPPAGIPAARPLKLPPREHEPVTFEGSSSGRGHGQVTGWSPQLPFVSPRAQLVVTTGPISRPGDSGAALLDGDGLLLGFCQETSAFGVANPYSSWIWADSVFQFHELT